MSERFRVELQLAGRRSDDAEARRVADTTARDLLCGVRQFPDLAQYWHRSELGDSRATGGITAKALSLHATNFGLWHHEDAVRCPGIADEEVVRRKRRIDDLNAQRNAAIEDLDESLLDRFGAGNRTAPLHTETPGAIVDRLSVLALRIVHTKAAEQPGPRLAILHEQYEDLLNGLEQFLARTARGEIRFKLYRQFKSAGQRSHCHLFETRDI